MDKENPTTERPHYRPPVGLPLARQRSLGGFLVSVLLHILIILALIVPFAPRGMVQEVLGFGGPGPAGGGGGGSSGSGKFRQERVDFVKVQAPPPAATPSSQPVPTPVPPPVVPPEPEVKPPEPDPVPPEPVVAVVPDSLSAGAAGDSRSNDSGSGGAGSGSGGGVGAGAGPGKGGGVGSGTGTGRGSGSGAGTGGGDGTAYPPTPTELFLPPLPVPGKARGTIVVTFDVDSTGKVLDLSFPPTKDSGYNKKLREALALIRFRPAVNEFGVPIRARTEITYSL